MDAFELVIAKILQNEGYWVQVSFKVRLESEDKAEIDSPSSPRWELDVLAYKPLENLLMVVECKSYLDSRGVRMIGFGSAPKASSRFKLFNQPKTREVVFRRLKQQLTDSGLIQPDPRIVLCLAAGKIVASDQPHIQSHFDENGWKLFDRRWIREGLRRMADSGYENDVAAITAKLLDDCKRKPRKGSPSSSKP